MAAAGDEGPGRVWGFESWKQECFFAPLVGRKDRDEKLPFFVFVL
jgi:hypothetical protein